MSEDETEYPGRPLFEEPETTLDPDALPDEKPVTTTTDLENGIFSLTISLYHALSETIGSDEAAKYIATYLEKLAVAMRRYKENKE